MIRDYSARRQKTEENKKSIWRAAAITSGADWII